MGEGERLESEKVVVASPLSFTGSAKRIWRITWTDNPAVRWLLAIPAALLLILLAWVVVAGWYVVFGLLVVPWRVLFGRRKRRRRQRDAQHREVVDAARDRDDSRATDRQVSYIQSLVSRWDPDASSHYAEASAGTLRRALDAAGLGDYDRRTLERMSKTEASEAITALKQLDE